MATRTERKAAAKARRELLIEGWTNTLASVLQEHSGEVMTKQDALSEVLRRHQAKILSVAPQEQGEQLRAWREFITFVKSIKE